MNALVYASVDQYAEEDWFVKAKEESDEIANRIAELDEASLSPEEREYRAFSKPKIAEANNKFEEDKTENKIEFVEWFVNKYVPEDKRKPLPENAN